MNMPQVVLIELKGKAQPKMKFCHYLRTIKLFQTCETLSSVENKIRQTSQWKSTDTKIVCLPTYSFFKIFFCVTQKTESHTGMKLHERVSKRWQNTSFPNLLCNMFTSVDIHISYLKARCSWQRISTEFLIIICCRLAVTALYKQSWRCVPPGGSGGALSCDLPVKTPVSVVSGKSCLHWKLFMRVDLRGKKGSAQSPWQWCDEGDSPTLLDSHTLYDIFLFSQLSHSDWAGLSGYRCQLRLIKIDDAYHTVVSPCNLCLIACNLRQSIFPIITVSVFLIFAVHPWLCTLIIISVCVCVKQVCSNGCMNVHMHDVRKMYSYKSLTLTWLFKLMPNNSQNTLKT